MESLLYTRISELCNEHGITINKLEYNLGFSKSTIIKWKNTSSPSADKLLKIAKYFNVSTDYLVGNTDIPSTISSVLDLDIISLQRAKRKMSPQDRERMMNMIKAGFDYAFSENVKDEEDDKGGDG